jgi:hypothetical protein
MLVVLLFRLNILILLKEGLEKNSLQGPEPLSALLSSPLHTLSILKYQSNFLNINQSTVLK